VKYYYFVNVLRGIYIYTFFIFAFVFALLCFVYLLWFYIVV
jgi:hypothetical protein